MIGTLAALLLALSGPMPLMEPTEPPPPAAVTGALATPVPPLSLPKLKLDVTPSVQAFRCGPRAVCLRVHVTLHSRETAWLARVRVDLAVTDTSGVARRVYCSVHVPYLEPGTTAEREVRDISVNVPGRAMGQLHFDAKAVIVGADRLKLVKPGP